jgi:hypothetical protein
MKSGLNLAVTVLVTAGVVLGMLGFKSAVEKGHLDHIEMAIQLQPVITFSKTDPRAPLLHVRVDAVAHVPLSVWFHQEIYEVKLREALAFEIRNTPAKHLVELDQALLKRQITHRAQTMHGIKLIDLEFTRFSTASS